MTDRGGFKQRMLRKQEGRGRGSAPTPKPQSHLGLLLVRRWCWGKLSLPVLQMMAQAAEDDGLDLPLIRLAKNQGNSPPAPTPPFKACFPQNKSKQLDDPSFLGTPRPKM